eukprot:jgi/Mesen1/896/ME001156S00139
MAPGVLFGSEYHKEMRARSALLARGCETWGVFLEAQVAATSSSARALADHVRASSRQLSSSPGAAAKGVLLRDGAARASFLAYAASTKYARPLASGVGYAERVVAGDRDAFEKDTKACIRSTNASAGGAASCRFHGTSSEYAPLLAYTATGGAHEPASSEGGGVISSFGFDMLSFAPFRDAILRARDRGTTGALSAPLVVPPPLLSGSNQTRPLAPAPTLLLVVPVYANVSAYPAATSARLLREACQGYLLTLLSLTAMPPLDLHVTPGVGNIEATMFDVSNPRQPVVLFRSAVAEAGGRESGGGRGGGGRVKIDASEERQLFPAALPALHLSDATRTFEVRCRHRRKQAFPVAPFLWAGVSLVVLVVSSLVLWVTIQGVHRMERDCRQMAAMRDRMQEAKLSAEAASQAKGAGRALCTLINDILDLSKIEAEKLDLERIPFEIRSELDDVLGMFVERAAEKDGTELAAFVADGVPSLVVGDPLRFRQVLINLIGNAFKFTSGGHIFLMVRIAEPGEIITHDPDAPAPAATTTTPTSGGAASASVLSSSLLTTTAPAHRRGDSWASRSGPGGADSEESGLVRLLSGDAGGDDAGSGGRAARAGNGGVHTSLSGRPVVESVSSWRRTRELLDWRRCGSMRGSCCHRDGQSVRLVISVEDTGCGIPESARKLIFKPFSQADSSTSRLHGGTGIGLSICQHLVQMMGGCMSFDSKVGVGTTFYFDLELACVGLTQPCVGPPDACRGHLASSATASEIRGGHVLVIDDLPVRRAVTITYLRRLGLQVSLCSTPDEIASVVSVSVHSGAGTATAAASAPALPAPVAATASVPAGRQAGVAAAGAVAAGGGQVAAPGADSEAGAGAEHAEGAPRASRLGVAAQMAGGMSSACHVAGSNAGSETRGKSSPLGSKPTGGAAGVGWALDGQDKGQGQGQLTLPLPAVVLIDADCLARTCGSGERLLRLLAEAAPAGGPRSPRPVASGWAPGMVLLTHGALPEDDDRAHGRRGPPKVAGFDAILRKPLRRSALAACLRPFFAAKLSPSSLSSSAAAEGARAPHLPGGGGGGGHFSSQDVYLRTGPGLLRQPSGRLAAAGAGSSFARVASGAAGGHSEQQQQPHQQTVRAKEGTVAPGGGGTRGAGGGRGGAGGGLLETLSASLGGKSLLVVDDNMVNRKVIGKMLQRYGAVVTAVDGGKKAVEKLAQPHAFDCVFMDLQMPEMDGFQATRQARQLELEADPSGGVHTPIFALTADIIAGTREKCTEAGMDGFLSKPIEEDQLARVLSLFLAAPPPAQA